MTAASCPGSSVTVDGRAPVPVQVDERSTATTRYDAMVDGLGDSGHDPT